MQSYGVLERRISGYQPTRESSGFSVQRFLDDIFGWPPLFECRDEFLCLLSASTISYFQKLSLFHLPKNRKL